MKAAWSAFLTSKDQKARTGSSEVNVMGLCDGARDLRLCTVQIEEN